MNQINLVVIGGGLNSAVGYAHFSACRMDNLFVYKKGFFSRDLNTNMLSGSNYGLNSEDIYDSIDSIIDDSLEIDCWLVLTPTPTHYEVLKKLKRTNKPVICEKALCSSYAEALNLLNEFNNNNLFVIFNYTSYPMVREAREMVKIGMLGDIITINVEMPQSGFIKRNNVDEIPKPQGWRMVDNTIATISLDLGVHVHSVIKFICNVDPLELFAISNSKGINKDVIDNLFCLLKYEKNIVSNIWYSKSALGYSNG